MDFVKGADLPRTRASVRRLDRCAIGRVRVKGFRVPGATGVWRFPAMTWLRSVSKHLLELNQVGHKGYTWWTKGIHRLKTGRFKKAVEIMGQPTYMYSCTQ